MTQQGSLYLGINQKRPRVERRFGWRTKKEFRTLALATVVLASQLTMQAAHAAPAYVPENEQTRPTELANDASIDDIFSVMFGKKTQEAIALPYPVIISGLNKGDVEMRPGTAPGTTEINRRDIVDVLMPFLVEERQSALLHMKPSLDVVTTGDLNDLGMQARFDHTNLLLIIDIPLEHREVVPIALERRGDPTVNLETATQAKHSAIFNVAAGSTYVHASKQIDKGIQSAQINLSAILNYSGWVLETGARYSDNAENRYVRNDTRLTRDLVERKVRLEAGDLSVPTSGLQGNPELAGVSLFRNFGLKPYEEFQTNPSQAFELQRPARVSVYINGLFVRELRLVAGRYNLTDLPLRAGIGNDVTLEIQYDTGEVDRVVFSAFFDFRLLKKGLTEYSFSAGPRATILDGKREYDTDNVAFSWFYRKGITDAVTLGLNAQADMDMYNIGTESYAATGLGSFGLLAGLSDTPDGSGTSVTGLYRWSDTNLERQARFDLQARMQDENFSTLGGSAGNYKYDIAARVSSNLNSNTRAQLSTGYRKRHGSSQYEQSYSALINRKTRYGTLGLNVRYADDQQDDEWSAGITFSARFGNGFTQFSHDTRRNSSRASYSSNMGRGVGSFGYDTTYSRQAEIDELRGGITYFANRYEGRVEHRMTQANIEAGFGSEMSTDVFVGSALVFADGKMALSRPVLDSFAIFDTNEGAGDFEVAVDPQTTMFGTTSRFAAKSSWLGGAVVPDLNAYYARTIEIDSPDAPAGTSLGGHAVSFVPGYRGGYVVKVGTDRNVSVMSILVDSAGNPAAFAAGYAIIEGGERKHVFSNGGGRFFIDGLKHGETVRLEFESPEGMIAEFKVPDGEIGVIRLSEPVQIYPAELKEPYHITTRIIDRGP